MMRIYRRLLSLLSVLLTACTVLASPMAISKNGVSVNVHGVNYTAEPFQYVLTDPSDPSNTGGGEHIGPFSAGGIMCCYQLPKQWTPGMRVQVHATHWVEKGGDGKIQEFNQVHTVEVPRYGDGKVGELWVLRTREGAIELVVSNVQPGHRDWPGRVKGWPEPSLEYQRERWELSKKIAENSVNTYRQLLAELKDDPEKSANLSWVHDKKYGYDIDLKQFSGPDDPAYRAHLKRNYEKGLVSAQNRLQQIVSRKP